MKYLPNGHWFGSMHLPFGPLIYPGLQKHPLIQARGQVPTALPMFSQVSWQGEPHFKNTSFS